MRICLVPTPRRFSSRLIAALALVTLASTTLATGSASADRAATPSAEQVVPAVQEFPPGTPLKNLPLGVAWGDNQHGALGDGTTTARLSPVAVRGGSLLDDKEVSAVDSGNTHTCAIAESALYCWGDNNDGELGIGDVLTDHPIPTRVKGLLAGHAVTAVSAGGAHTCAVADGAAYCWGYNLFGQLGNGGVVTANTPTQVAGPLQGKTVTAISAGDLHTCAIADGKAYCWGNDKNGRLGNGLGKDKQTEPVAINTLSGLGGRVVDSITAGHEHSCATAEGLAFCWGNNNHGQLGDGTLNTSSVPTPIVAPADVISIAAGANATCGIFRPGTVPVAGCWGEGTAGALGNGDTKDRLTPNSLSPNGTFNNTGVAAISISSNGGCALERNQAYCWGNNEGIGRLGTGTQGSSLRPVPVLASGVLSDKIVLTVSAELGRSSGVAVTAPTFSDVTSAHPFRDEISWLAGTGTTRGYDDGKYQPGTDIDRQAMAAFLFRYTNPGQPDPTCDPKKDRIFTDVHTTDTFCGPIEWLTTAGVNPLQGITPPDGWKFGPLDPTLRGTMADWLFHVHHPHMVKPVCAGMTRLFPDVAANNGSCGTIEWLARAGITTGYDNGTYQPAAAVARQSMAAFLRRLNALTTH